MDRPGIAFDESWLRHFGFGKTKKQGEVQQSVLWGYGVGSTLTPLCPEWCTSHYDDPGDWPKHNQTMHHPCQRKGWLSQ